MLNLYNSLTNKTEIFIPNIANIVKMYVCGPTVYDYIHIGNARVEVVYDVLYRILSGIYGKGNVTYVRNLTDVDDKINQRAKEQHITIGELTTNMIANFHDDVAYLGCLKPTLEPKATEHISEMIAIIEQLIAQNYAYVTAENNVYFSVQKFAEYGKLANRNIDDLIENVRIENLQDKNHSHDFALWKAKEEGDIESSIFDSPWGEGRPGWHIECVAMSNKHLGENFDIHGGGVDLIFPHHTNEIAQAKCAFKDSQFAKYWVHNGTLTVNKHKMSKSLRNFITVKEMRDKSVPGEVLRYFLMSANY
ncbi:MAG: cysteine--tRNA ligase, partial [Rickettsiaceae bacterium]|nr:cysteine--tRNA ligase [Rickettsiaceae bacterium]